MRLRFTLLGVLVACGMLAGATSASEILSFSVQQWTSGPGADGRVYALVVVDAEWSWREARALAQEVGGDLASTPDWPTLGFVAGLASRPGAFECAGPWIGGYRFGGHPWRWTSNAPFEPLAWAPGRPIQSSLIDAALCLGGSGSPDGTWIDSLPGPDAGASTTSAVLVWNSFRDCNGNGTPDLLEIAFDAALDRDLDDAIDNCTKAEPADLNSDGVVDGADLGMLLGAWGTTSAQADINRDGTVDGADLGMLLGAWTIN